MDIEGARQFLRDNHQGILATFRADGRPQLSPVTPGVDDQGRAVVSTREPSMKVRNLRRDPRASLCVFTDRFYGPWVRVDGAVEIVELPEAMDGLVALYRQAQGEHPDWDEYRQAMVEQRRVLLALTIEDAGPTREG